MTISTDPITLVLGGSGMLGREVVARLREQRRRVRVMTRSPDRCTELLQLGAELVRGDLIEPASVRAACAGVDRIVASAHSLLGAGRHASPAVDGAGHERLIDLALSAGVARLVYVSVHGAHPDHPAAFWRTKAQTAAYLRRSGLAHTILEPSAFMDFHADVLIGKPIREGKAVTWFGTGDNPRNFVAAADVAQFVLLGLKDDRPASETIEVGGPENLSNLDVVRHYERLLERRAKVKRLPLALGRVLRAAVGLFHAGIGQALHCALLAETSDQTLDGTRSAAAHGITLLPLSTWLRRPHTFVRSSK